MIKESIQDLPGGLALQTPSGAHIDSTLHAMPLQTHYYLPLVNYQRDVLQPNVSVGDKVMGGELIASGVIAPTSGTITQLTHHTWPHPSLTKVKTLTLAADGQDDFLTLPNITLCDDSAEEKLQRIERCSVHGLGGAGFNTAKKIQRVMEHNAPTLIVNAVECEPGINCDDALIQNHSVAVIEACDALCKWLNVSNALLAIEDDKTTAIEKLTQALLAQQSTMQLAPLSAIYPSGAESTLVQRLTGIQLTQGQPAAKFGVLCINVATVLAIHQAWKGLFSAQRILSVTTQDLKHSVNLQVRFGTPIDSTVQFAASVNPFIAKSLNENRASVSVGGPLSGFTQTNDSTPVMATSNALLVGAMPIKKPQSACIRCTDCATVCPVNLLPQELYSAVSAQDTDTAQRYALDNCILCGCCDLVCPANIPLTSWFQHGKDELKHQRAAEQNAVMAKARSEKHNTREQQRALDKAKADAQRRKVAAQRSQSAIDIKAALERVKNKRPSS